MEITFPGGAAVDARQNGFTIRTDQAESNGGQGSAPSPFDLFLASIGTCAGFYALRFCQQRDLDTTHLRVTLDTERHPETHRIEKIRLTTHLPPEFPAKYRKPILRAMDQCSVKYHIAHAPEFELATA